METGTLKPGRATGPNADSNTDPMCGKHLNERDPQLAEEWNNQLYFFCSKDCRQQFKQQIQTIPQMNK